MSNRIVSETGLGDFNFKSTNNKGYGIVILKELYELLGLSHRASRTNFLYWREKYMHYFRSTCYIVDVKESH